MNTKKIIKKDFFRCFVEVKPRGRSSAEANAQHDGEHEVFVADKDTHSQLTVTYLSLFVTLPLLLK